MAQEEGPRAQPSPQRNSAQVYLTPQWDGGLTTPGVSASASAEADSDDEFLQDLWRTPARSWPAGWLADLLLTPPPPERARPASPPRGSGELASEEELHMLFSASVAECKGLPVEHWNFDEGKVHHPLHDLVDGAAFYIGATVNPRRRFLGGQSRGGSMPGHCLSWDRLTVVHLANGIGARRVETNLISYCKGRYGHLCTNTAMDSRGVSAQEPAFVYVCTGRRAALGVVQHGQRRIGVGSRTCDLCPLCGGECTGHRMFPGDAYCTCAAQHEWDSPLRLLQHQL